MSAVAPTRGSGIHCIKYPALMAGRGAHDFHRAGGIGLSHDVHLITHPMSTTGRGVLSSALLVEEVSTSSALLVGFEFHRTGDHMNLSEEFHRS
jgi:hypothetical protein